MDVKAWQDRLKQTFNLDQRDELNGLFERELFIESTTNETFAGYADLMDSFLKFFIETIHLAFSKIEESGWPKELKEYPNILVYFVVSFRNFRVCEILCAYGYPFDGYALLRNLKDRTIFIAAIVHEMTSLRAVLGLSTIEEQSSGSEEKWRDIHNRRKTEQIRILNEMIRNRSGLPEEDISELNVWEQFFHEEVHGSLLSFGSDIRSWIETGRRPDIYPSFDTTGIAMYINRVCEIAWLFTRLFPFLQITENSFGSEWFEKYKVLDESFRHTEEQLFSIGKVIGRVFINFVEEKFSFPDPFFYREHET